MKATATLIERLQIARRDAVETKIALRHAQNAAADYLTWRGGEIDYKSLGGSDGARKRAFEALLGGDEKASTLEQTLRTAEDENDTAQCALDCVLDEKHVTSDQTWAVLADWVRSRTGQAMNSRETAGREILKEKTETTLADSLANYHERYGGVEWIEPSPPEAGQDLIPF